MSPLDPLAAPVAAFAVAVTAYVNTLVNGPADAKLSLPTAPVWPPEEMPAAVTPGIDVRSQRAGRGVAAPPI